MKPNLKELKKLLHISNDDRFITIGKKIFENVANTQNDFWIFPNQKEFEFVKFNAENLFEVNINTQDYYQKINEYDLICIHFLNPKLFALLKSKQIKKPILWIGWGGDYYWMMDTYKDFNIILPHTSRLIQRIPFQKYIQSLVKKLKKLKTSPKLESINQIQYFAPVFKSEYELIRKNFPHFKPQFVEWNYGYIDQEVTDFYSSLWRHGNKIMIGNSATPTNNHIDVMQDLKDVLAKEELIIPLSYGHPLYKNFIAKYARKNFNKIEVLEKLIPEKEFDQIMLNCSNLIVGSIRQQAVATISKALYMGINVFLYEDSLNYKFFKENSFYIYSIEELKTNPHLLKTQLSKEQIIENRERINRFWSIDKNSQSIANLLESLN